MKYKPEASVLVVYGDNEIDDYTDIFDYTLRKRLAFFDLAEENDNIAQALASLFKNGISFTIDNLIDMRYSNMSSIIQSDVKEQNSNEKTALDDVLSSKFFLQFYENKINFNSLNIASFGESLRSVYNAILYSTRYKKFKKGLFRVVEIDEGQAMRRLELTLPDFLEILSFVSRDLVFKN